MEVLNKIIKGAGDCFVEALITTVKTDNLNFKNNEFTNADSGEINKLEIRVSKGLRSAYAWTNNLDDWRECLNRAKGLMKASSELKTETGLSKTSSVSKSFINQSISKATTSLLKDKGVELINNVIDEGVSVSELNISKSIINKRFINSNETIFNQDNSSINASVECVSGNSSSWDSISSDGLNFDFNQLGKRTAILCRESLNPKKLKTGLYNVVLDFNAINELIEVLMNSFEANKIIEHNSLLEGKKGVKLFSDSLTIKDKGVMSDSPFNSLMDDEGVMIKETTLINKGVINSFINDLYTARLMGDKPTGNSAGLMKRGFVSNNNIEVVNGDAGNDELINNSVYIHSLMGTHTANIISGDFALSTLNCFKYDTGVKTPVRDVMISANVFELFNKVLMIGKESIINGGLKTPMIKFNNVQLIT